MRLQDFGQQQCSMPVSSRQGRPGSRSPAASVGRACRPADRSVQLPCYATARVVCWSAASQALATSAASSQLANFVARDHTRPYTTETDKHMLQLWHSIRSRNKALDGEVGLESAYRALSGPSARLDRRTGRLGWPAPLVSATTLAYLAQAINWALGSWKCCGSQGSCCQALLAPSAQSSLQK